MRWLLGVVAAVVIISFVWFYNRADLAKIRQERIGEIYGREILRQEATKLFRHFGLLQDLGLFELIIPLAQAPSMEMAQQEFIFNLMVLREEARRMNIVPTSAQIIATQMTLPVFQTNGKFNSKRLASFIQENLTPRGFAESQMDEAMSDLIKFRAIKTLVDDLASVPPLDARREWERLNSLYSVGVIKLSIESFKEGITPSEEEIGKRFEIRSSTLKTEPRRKVKIGRLSLSEEEKALEGRARVDALQRLANKAFGLTQMMLEEGADFDRLAAEAGMEVATTEAFFESNPPETLNSIAGAVDAVRLMTPEDPDSDVLQAKDDFVVFHLVEYEEARPMTLEEARSLLTEDLVNEAAGRRMREEAAKLQNSLTAAGPFSEEAEKILAERGLKLERPEPFPLTKIPESLETAGTLTEALISLPPGQLSSFIPTNSGGALLAVETITPPDADAYEKERITHELRSLNRERMMAFSAWLKERRMEANLRLVGMDNQQQRQ